MEDITQRLINALRKAVTNARNADDAREAAELADALEAQGAPIPAPVLEQSPVDNDHVAPGAEPFAHMPPASAPEEAPKS